MLTGRKLIFFFSKRNSIAKEENVHSLQGWVCLFVLLFVCGDDPFTLWSVLLHQLKYYWSSVTVSKLVLLWLLECLDSKIRPSRHWGIFSIFLQHLINWLKWLIKKIISTVFLFVFYFLAGVLEPGSFKFHKLGWFINYQNSCSLVSSESVQYMWPMIPQ